MRRAHAAEIRALEELGLNARAAGADSESTARLLHQMRQDLEKEFTDLLSPAEQQKKYSNNLKKYGDVCGPTIEYLRTIRGYSWEQIIAEAVKVGR